MKYKYKNYDKRCHYPYTHDGINYCWGYAVKVDKGIKIDMPTYCKGCEFFKKEHPMTNETLWFYCPCWYCRFIHHPICGLLKWMDKAWLSIHEKMVGEASDDQYTR